MSHSIINACYTRKLTVAIIEILLRENVAENCRG